jgi:phosphatidate cytidylyltransferase
LKTVLKRILITVIGIPLILSVLFFLHYLNYAAFMVVIIVFTFLGSKETHALMIQANTVLQLRFPPWITILIPVASHLGIFYFPGFPILELVFLFFILIICGDEILTGHSDNFSGSAARIGSNLIIAFYPALFVIFLIKMTSLEHAGWLLVMLFLLIFSNDVFAYLFGMSLGKTSRNIFKVSPGKSTAGFVGGTVMTVIIGFVYLALIPSIFPTRTWWLEALLFLLISVTSNIGDLFESVLKRSAKSKDSGVLMPGRGGILDSIDSIVFSAPFFYIFVTVIQSG